MRKYFADLSFLTIGEISNKFALHSITGNFHL